MKVLYVWTEGMSPNVVSRLKALERRGVEVGLVCAKSWPIGGAMMSAEDVETTFPVFSFPTLLTGRGPYYVYVPGIGAAVRKFSPDLIHLREEVYTVYSGHFLAERWIRFRSVPFIFESWQNIRKRYPIPSRWIERIGYQSAIGAIAGVPSIESVLRQGGFKGPIDVVPLGGLDLESFRQDGESDRVSFGVEGAVVGYVGRLVAPKGIDLLIRAIARIEKASLVIVGDGPEREALEELAKELRASVIFAGPADPLRMPDILRSFDVLVLPSVTTVRWKEQWGRVLTEAMACGVPVIGSSSGEIPYVIGDAGLIFNEGSVDELVVNLSKVIDDEPFRQQLISKGLNRAKQFSWDKHAEKIESFYQKVVR